MATNSVCRRLIVVISEQMGKKKRASAPPAASILQHFRPRTQQVSAASPPGPHTRLALTRSPGEGDSLGRTRAQLYSEGFAFPPSPLHVFFTLLPAFPRSPSKVAALSKLAHALVSRRRERRQRRHRRILVTPPFPDSRASTMDPAFPHSPFHVFSCRWLPSPTSHTRPSADAAKGAIAAEAAIAASW